MKTIAPLVVAWVALAACNAPAPQASAPPTPGSVAVTRPGFQLPEGTDCSGKNARYRAVQDNDLAMAMSRRRSTIRSSARRTPPRRSAQRAATPRPVNGRFFTKAARLSDRSLSERVAQVIGDKTWHPRFINVLRIAHNVHARKLGQRVARQERLDPRLEPGGRKRKRHQFHACDAL